jgi:hypothetical protein
MISTLTLDEAIKLAPCIASTQPHQNVSSKYQFVSTKDMLHHVCENGWRITNVASQSKSLYSQHRVTLVHSDYLSYTEKSHEGIPRIEMFNSHDRTKRLMFAVGYFRFVCSNGLIAASGPYNSINTKHTSYAKDKLSFISNIVNDFSKNVPNILTTIDKFKQTFLDEQEQHSFAEYAIRCKYNYRQEFLPIKTMKQNVELLLQSRREEDSRNSAWEIYNRVQENIIRGIRGHSRPLNGYSDTIRINQMLWKAAEVALDVRGEQFNNKLRKLLLKKNNK